MSLNINDRLLAGKGVGVIVIGKESNGNVGLFRTSIVVTEGQYNLGLHYDQAQEQAEESGYEGPFLCVDEGEALFTALSLSLVALAENEEFVVANTKHAIGTGNQVYVVSGSEVGSDIDITRVVLADVESEAVEAFTAFMLEDVSDDVIERNEQAHGTAVFVNVSEYVGRRLSPNTM